MNKMINVTKLLRSEGVASGSRWNDASSEVYIDQSHESHITLNPSVELNRASW